MEAGRAATGTTAADDALDRVRKSRPPGTPNVAAACEEVLALALVEHTRSHNVFDSEDFERRQGGFYARMDELADRFALHQEFDHLIVNLSSHDNAGGSTTRASFDPGIITRSSNSTLGRVNESLLSGIAVVRAAQRCGLPLSWIARGEKKAVTDLAAHLYPFGVRPACSIMCRLTEAGGGRHAIDSVLDRMTVATLTDEEVDDLADAAEQAVRLCLGLSLGGAVVRYPMNLNGAAEAPLEILSRLTLRLSPQRLLRLLDLAIEAVERESSLWSFDARHCLDDLFRRLAFAWPAEGLGRYSYASSACLCRPSKGRWTCSPSREASRYRSRLPKRRHSTLARR